MQQLIGGAILVAVGTAFGERLHLGAIAPVSWWAWLYMSLFVSLGAFSAYAYALATLPVSTVATYAYVNPVIAVLLGVVVAGERFSVLQLAGGAIVLVAVVMVIAAERRSGVTAPRYRFSLRPGRESAVGLLLADVLDARHHRPPLAERVDDGAVAVAGDEGGDLSRTTAPCSFARATTASTSSQYRQVEWLTAVPAGAVTRSNFGFGSDSCRRPWPKSSSACATVPSGPSITSTTVAPNTSV